MRETTDFIAEIKVRDQLEASKFTSRQLKYPENHDFNQCIVKIPLRNLTFNEILVTLKNNNFDVISG